MDLDKYLDDRETLFLSIIKSKFNNRIEIARNREKALETYIKGNFIEYFYCFKDSQLKRFLINTLYDDYELGNRIENSVKQVLKHAHNYSFGEDNIEENNRIVKNQKTIIRFFAKYTAYQRFILFIENNFPEYYKLAKKEYTLALSKEEISDAPFKRDIPFLDKNNTISSITWQKTNETEFVQMVYSLYYAGALNNKDRSVTKLVVELASLLNFSLSNHWQSTLSNSITRANMDYKPTIIKTIEKGFEKLKQNRELKEK